MKLVICENCGAKYRLNDNEDINSYECNICTGNLKEVDRTPSSNTPVNNPPKDLELVYCQECGMKYRISLDENINEYECSNCGGSLKYINKSQQEKEEKRRQNTKTAKTLKQQDIDKLKTELDGFKEDIKNYDNEENKMDEIQDQYELALYRYYGELKRELKKEYLQNILKIPYEGNALNQLAHRFADKVKSDNAYDIYYGSIHDYNEEIDTEDSKYFEKLTPKEIGLILGTLITIIGLLSLIMINIIYSIIILIIGIITLIYGFRKEEESDTDEIKEDVIYSKLLTLPGEYYVLNKLKTPGLNKIIDNVVIGPTGLFTITNKEEDEETSSYLNDNSLKSKIKSFEKHLEEKYHIGEDEEDTINTENMNLLFKQDVLDLNRELLKFLEENGIEMAIEPLAGFTNNNISVINVILDDEDLFMDELLYRIINTPSKLDDVTINKTAILLSQYSLN